jgi:hypothetical protein
VLFIGVAYDELRIVFLILRDNLTPKESSTIRKRMAKRPAIPSSPFRTLHIPPLHSPFKDYTSLIANLWAHRPGFRQTTDRRNPQPSPAEELCNTYETSTAGILRYMDLLREGGHPGGTAQAVYLQQHRSDVMSNNRQCAV